LAIAWVLHHPRVDAAIIGPRSVAHLDEALRSMAISLSADDARTLAAFFDP
jgi:NDP-hexose 2,3-enoyl reductase